MTTSVIIVQSSLVDTVKSFGRKGQRILLLNFQRQVIQLDCILVTIQEWSRCTKQLHLPGQKPESGGFIRGGRPPLLVLVSPRVMGSRWKWRNFLRSPLIEEHHLEKWEIQGSQYILTCPKLFFYKIGTRSTGSSVWEWAEVHTWRLFGISRPTSPDPSSTARNYSPYMPWIEALLMPHCWCNISALHNLLGQQYCSGGNLVLWPI